MRPAELLRSSTFRLALLYMILFAGSASMLLGFIYWSTVAFMAEQVDTTIETEIQGLAEQYRQRGLNGLVQTINDRVERNADSSALYLFTWPTYRPLAGNLVGWPKETPSEDGWRHERITLRPDSSLEGYCPIVLKPDAAIDLRVIGEFVAVLA